MSISRRVARPMISGIFIMGGLDAARHPESKVKAAEAVTKVVAGKVPGLPDDTETLVRINGVVQVVAGLALATGKFRRLASLALIGSIVPTTVAGHRFWEETDEATRAQQRVHFFKNLGLLGALILAAVDTEGAPSLTWRAKRQARVVGHTVAAGGTAAKALGGGGRSQGAKAGRKARQSALASASAAHDHALAAVDAATPYIHAAPGEVAKQVRAAAPYLLAIPAQARKQAEYTVDAASPYFHTGADKAAELLSLGVGRSGEIVSQVRDHLPHLD
jgi:putative oxidoreductase